MLRLSGVRAGLLPIAIIAAILVFARGSLAGPAPDGDTANQIIVVGLLPLTKAGGSPDLIGLRQAQDLRKSLERALSDLSHEPVIGHDALTARLGKKYLPKWFDCKNDITCIDRVVAPLRDQGNRLAITGEYYVEHGTYHVRMIAFFVVDGTVSKELTFEMSDADVQDAKRWADNLQPLLASRVGRIRVGSNVAGVTCTIDGQPCAFEPDGQTLEATPGEHTIELSKDGYQPEKVPVTVETGTTQEVAIALKPAEQGHRVAVIGGPRHAPSLTAVRTDKPIDIDGKLDEPAWQKAWVETNFTQNFPDEAQAPTERTELRVLYDDDAIYIGIRCYDSHPDAIVSRLTRRDRDVEADKVTVDISSRNDHQTAYTFQVDAANVQLDGTRFNDTDSSTDWDGVWYSATSRDAKGWIAEIEIPLPQLRYTGDTTSFGFQVRRYIERRQEVDEWAYVPRTAQGEVSYYGTLEGLTDLHPKRLVEIAPYDSRSLTYVTKQGVLDGTTSGGRIGADVKIGLTPGLTFDGTVNPDFGTVEVDEVVLNLSTVEVSFPEKRPFFIEGADLFSTPFQLFYSRRIGRTPPAPVIGDYTEPAPSGQILAAGKVTGSLAHRLSIGLLDAVTSREDAVVARPGSTANEKVLVDPLSNFAVLRLRQDFGLNSSIGVLATAVDRVEPANEAAPMTGDHCPLPHLGLKKPLPFDGRCYSDAYTGGLDFVLRTDDGTWGASGQVVGSLLEHGPVRLVPDGTQIHPGDLGWGVTASAGKLGGKHWLYQLNYSYMAPELEINDAGFNPNANDQLVQALVTLRSTTKLMGLLNTSLRLNLQLDRFADTGKITNTGLGFGSGFSGAFLIWTGTFPNFWTFKLNGGPMLTGYNNRETGDGALQQVPGLYRMGAEIGTDPRKSVVADAGVVSFKTQRGITADAFLTLNLHPASFLDVDVLPEIYLSTGVPRSVAPPMDNMDGSTTYTFQDLDSESASLLVRSTLTLSPTLSLQVYGQLFVDSGHFSRLYTATGTGPHAVLDRFVAGATPSGNPNDFSDSAINVNAFLRWEYRPGSALWLAYTREQDNTAYDPMMDGAGRLRLDKLYGPSTDVFLIKLSYLWEPFAGHR